MKYSFGTTPRNKKLLAKFKKLSSDQMVAVLDEVERLYDGTRTLAACWHEAMGKLQNA